MKLTGSTQCGAVRWRLKRFAVLLFFAIIPGIIGYSPVSAGAPLEDSTAGLLFQEANNFFHQANELLDTDREQSMNLYRKSLLRYERLVKDGLRNGKLFYNIGNIYFRLDDVGRAIRNYRLAERYIPEDPNLRQNLEYALSKRMDRIEEKQEEKILKTLFFWHYDVPLQLRLILFSCLYSVVWILAMLKLFFPGTISNWYLTFPAVLSVLLGGSLAVAHFSQAPVPGVVVAQEVLARKGDGVSYQPSFKAPLHAGTEFILKEDRGNWLHIELPDGRSCWVPDTSAELVIP